MTHFKSHQVTSPTSLKDQDEDDLDFELDYDKLTVEDESVLNKCALNYGLREDEFCRILHVEAEEREQLKQNKLLEEEKAQYSGRSSRRERRLAKDKRLKEQQKRASNDHNLLCFIVKDTSQVKDEENEQSGDDDDEEPTTSKFSSRNEACRKNTSKNWKKQPSLSLENNVTFITSFGAEEAEEEEKVKTHESQSLDLSSTSSFSSRLDAQSRSNLKRLKEEISSPSRSRSLSPISNSTTRFATTLFDKSVPKTQKQYSKENISSSNSDEDGENEEIALRNYLKRRQNRLE